MFIVIQCYHNKEKRHPHDHIWLESAKQHNVADEDAQIFPSRLKRHRRAARFRCSK